MKALTGAADQARQDSQWQYPIAAGSPLTVKRTAPQKQLPWYMFPLLMVYLLDGVRASEHILAPRRFFSGSSIETKS
ncbi:MAG: hypothetical protein OEV04_06770 [Nitrospira sp.]|nr:hypothetical protein [Nitrospira sp.]MDH5337790.1 hypothetical protein [Nitrospira sp.]